MTFTLTDRQWRFLVRWMEDPDFMRREKAEMQRRLKLAIRVSGEIRVEK